MRDQRGAEVLVDGEPGEHVGRRAPARCRAGRGPPRSRWRGRRRRARSCPRWASSSPLSVRNSVVLPAPLVPSIATASPRPTSRSSPNSTCTRPYQASRSRTSSSGPAGSSRRSLQRRSDAVTCDQSPPAASTNSNTSGSHGGRWRTTSPLRSESMQRDHGRRPDLGLERRRCRARRTTRAGPRP